MTFPLGSRPLSGQISEAEHDLVPANSVAVTLTSDFDLTDPALWPFGMARRLYVGTGGTVIARKLNDTGNTTYKNVASGSYLDGLWTLVKSTGNGTTASDIVAEY